jgi:hypothetical protein
VISALIFCLEASIGLAQAPCADQNKPILEQTIRDLLPKTALPARKAAVASGKQFLQKYNDCPDVKDFVAYLKTNIPGMEATIKKIEDAEMFQNLLVRFDAGMRSRNWDEVYAAGKLILAEKPSDFVDIEIVLGSIGLVETGRTPRVTKWNDDTLTYARQAIQDMEANKPFKTYGLGIKDGANFVYREKQNALGWMNYSVGYIYFFDKKDKKQGAGYLYKASQFNSDTKIDPIIYESIGGFYFDEVKRLGQEVADLNQARSKNDQPEVGRQKEEAIKAKGAILNGTTEAAMDAYARAYDLAIGQPARYPKTYTDNLYKKLQDLYDVRFGKADGFEKWIANVNKKPMPDPSQPVAPVTDPEPATVASTQPVGSAAATKSTEASKTSAKPRSKKKVTTKKRGH